MLGNCQFVNQANVMNANYIPSLLPAVRVPRPNHHARTKRRCGTHTRTEVGVTAYLWSFPEGHPAIWWVHIYFDHLEFSVHYWYVNYLCKLNSPISSTSIPKIRQKHPLLCTSTAASGPVYHHFSHVLLQWTSHYIFFIFSPLQNLFFTP